MLAIFDSGWATGDQLFSGAQQCKESGGTGKGPTVSMRDGALSFGCVSSLEV